MIRLFRIAVVLGTLVMSGPVSVWAQARLEVSVVQAQSGEPLAGVEVIVANAAVGLERQATTSDQGKVRFEGLPTSGTYAVYVPADADFYAARAEDVILRSNATRSVTLLRIPLTEAALDEITVTDASSFARLNTVDAQVAYTLDAAEVEALPVEGRDLTRALYRLPNVTQATGFYPEAPNVSINGANALYTTYLIDGLDNNENFLGGQKFRVPLGLVQDVTVLTNTFSAEFGRTGNGVFNVTTKSGSNDVSGEAFYLTRPGPVIDGESPFAQRDLSGNVVKDGFQRHQAGFSLGGPIRKDQTFYFVNVEQLVDLKDNRLTVPQLGINETVRGENLFTLASAKVDHRWSSRWRTSLRGHLGRVQIDRQGGGLEGGIAFPSAANVQDRNSGLVALQNTYFAGRYVLETGLQYSRFRWDYAEPANPTQPRVEVLGADGLPLAQLGHPGYTFDDLEQSWQLQQKVTAAFGRHTLRAGLDVLTSDFALSGGGAPNGFYQVRLTPAQEAALRSQNPGADLGIDAIPAGADVTFYSIELRPQAFGARQTQVGLYVEDQIAATPRLNLTLGLRYDYDSLSKGGADQADLNNLAPRFSFNYQLDPQSVLRGGYGIFYDKIVYAIYSDALQQNSTAPAYRQQLQTLIDQGLLPADTDLDRVTFDGNLTAGFVDPDFGYLQGPGAEALQDERAGIVRNDGRILNPSGYDNPYTHQFSLGYQRQFAADKLFYVDLVHTRSYNLFRLRDLNAPAPYQVTPAELAAADDPSALVRSQAEADATRPAGVVPGGARNIVVTETAGEARYWAASANLFKDRGRDDYAYRVSYTLSRLRNNTDDINFRAQDANDFGAEWGPSANDRTHVLSALGYYYPTPGLTVTFAALLQSGQPVNRIPDATLFGTTDLNGDGRAFGDAYVGNSDRFPGEARNSDRLPWSTTFDLSLAYDVTLGGHRLALQADVFNLFNTENLSGYSNNATQSNQVQVGPADSGVFVQRNAGPPRQFQFGVRYLF